LLLFYNVTLLFKLVPLTGRDKLLKEALSACNKSGYNGVVLLPTGSGKGRLMIEVAKILRPKNILYVCNTTLLRDKTFKDELHKWNAEYLIPIIDFECYQTTYKWIGRKYDLILADEFDASLTPEYVKTFTNNLYKNKILVSATLDDEKRKKAEKIAPVIFERGVNELINDKILNGINLYFINYNLTPEENGFYLHYNISFKKLLNQFQSNDVKKKLESLQIQRKHFLSSLRSSAKVTKWLINNLKPRDEKVLVFCGLSEQADRICINSFHEKNKNHKAFEDFEKGLIKVITVVNKVDRGLNIEGVRNIIHESVGRSKTKMVQRNGRGMRLNVNEKLNVFFLIPHFLTVWGERKPTIVLQWVMDSLKDMDTSNIKTIQYKENV